MKKALLGMVAIAGVSYGAYRWRSEPAPAAKHRDDLVTDRLWIDHMPRGERDMFNILALLDDDAVGVFQKMSAWVGEYEGFRFEANEGELRVVYPQSGKRETVRVRARTCNENGMDFCLEISGASRGVKKYYSREGWEIGAAHDLETVKQRVEALRTQITPAR